MSQRVVFFPTRINTRCTYYWFRKKRCKIIRVLRCTHLCWKIEGPLNLADFFTKLNDRIIFDQQYAMIQYIPTGGEPQEA